MRILDHPILGKLEPRKTVRIEVDGKPIEALEGEPIAAALVAHGIKTFRYTRRFNKPRGIFCAIGQCTDCVMVVNGIPNTRTCITTVEDGMKVETQHGLGRRQ
ncbi:MAG: (2Fe-2S)-binding protein [Chloroflexi bacterium]|nr:(2Fe-2S)-binding protein [Chloroflexota bacterium]